MSTCIVILLLWCIYKDIYNMVKEEQCFPTSNVRPSLSVLVGDYLLKIAWGVFLILLFN